MILPGNRTRLNGACPSSVCPNTIVAPIDPQDQSLISHHSAAAGAGAAVMVVVTVGMRVATRRTGRASSNQSQGTQREQQLLHRKPPQSRMPAVKSRGQRSKTVAYLRMEFMSTWLRFLWNDTVCSACKVPIVPFEMSYLLAALNLPSSAAILEPF
jgi:hypothetical protein